MKLSIETHLSYRLAQPSALLLQIEAVDGDGQNVEKENLVISSQAQLHRLDDEAEIGQRIWLEAETGFECTYTATVAVGRGEADFSDLGRTPLPLLDSSVVRYLMPSRYCHPERFFDFTSQNFGNLTGGAQIAAMSNWIKSNLRYDSSENDPSTDAFDSFNRRAGVCRDFAHVMIAMARAVAVPARFVSVYAPDVEPQDFHAVAEVYLDGSWHLVDATGMAEPKNIARIGVGRDAADASFLTSYGWIELQEQSVNVQRVAE